MKKTRLALFLLVAFPVFGNEPEHPLLPADFARRGGHGAGALRAGCTQERIRQHHAGDGQTLPARRAHQGQEIRWNRRGDQPPDYWKYTEYADRVNRQIFDAFEAENVSIALPAFTARMEHPAEKPAAPGLQKDSAG